MAMFTEEQLKVILGMGDLTEQERQMKEQQQEAALLRMSGGRVGTKRMDMASQMNRALQGYLGGKGRMEANKRAEEISAERRRVLEGLMGGGGGERNPNPFDEDEYSGGYYGQL